ncbi:MAG TPA: tricarballylate utilization protein TcuB, partial [Candidatus Dormibacteraeota bacterium]|nr:tricarballylate utilization protein TcuB [Candidatus Dormibacteraeota bacterium]
GPGSLYRLLPYAAMLTPFLLLGVWAAVAIAAAVARFVRATGGSVVAVVDAGALLRAGRSALGLEYLRGGGDGCYYPDSAPSHVRRWLHALTFYGFVLAFAATVAAAVMQDLLGLQPPFPVLSPPVVLGGAGGLAMIGGTAGLGAMKWRSDPLPASTLMIARDYSFLVTLNLVSVSGMLTLVLRSTAAAGALLVVHLGLVAALFLTMPYGKFVHFAYRYAALVRDRVEIRQAP